MLKIVSPIFCRKKSSLVCTLVTAAVLPLVFQDTHHVELPIRVSNVLTILSQQKVRCNQFTVVVVSMFSCFKIRFYISLPYFMNGFDHSGLWI